jgi:hypothetical protein
VRPNELTKAIIWSMREMGFMIHEMQERGELAGQGGDRKSNYHEDSLISLNTIGVSWVESSWSQMLSNVPEELGALLS